MAHMVIRSHHDSIEILAMPNGMADFITGKHLEDQASSGIFTCCFFQIVNFELVTKAAN